MRIGNLDYGLERISHRSVADEVKLPATEKVGPGFAPQQGELEKILSRFSLDEKGILAMRPAYVDPELLIPETLRDTRRNILELFTRAGSNGSRQNRLVCMRARDTLNHDDVEADEIEKAIMALMKG